MKKYGWMLLFFSFTVLGFAHQHVNSHIRPIHRAKIHPEQETLSFGRANSSNWSGYVAATDFQKPEKGSVSYVTGGWVVPRLIATTDATYSAIWVGIDGFLNGTVEQIGTSHNWENGRQQNYAWFEMYPQGAYEIGGFPVDAGDFITASVEYKGNHQFLLSITNHTKNVYTQIPTSYTISRSAARSSAEWIVEAPYSNSILPLADFHLATLTGCQTKIKGISGAINNPHWKNDQIIMMSSHEIKAMASSLMSQGSTFNVRWEHE